jgi:hypothetical protein
MTKRLTTAQVAKELGVCKQRINAKVKQGHYPNHGRCECGHAILIPRDDVDLDKRYRGRMSPPESD